MKPSIAKHVLDRTSVHTGNSSSGTTFAPGLEVLLCSAAESETPVSDKLLKQSRTSLTTSVRAEIATKLPSGRW